VSPIHAISAVAQLLILFEIGLSVLV